MTRTTTEAFFDAKYRAAADPWSFATSDYELHRYNRVLRALEGRRFELGYEPGCSIGVLSEQLAAYCDRLQACDISQTAVEQARERCRGLSNVQIHHASLAAFIPHDADLYAFCEVGYYMSAPKLEQLLRRNTKVLRDGATLISCHWRGGSADHLLSGDQVHEIIHVVPGLVHDYSEQHVEFRLDRWIKRKAEA